MYQMHYRIISVLMRIMGIIIEKGDNIIITCKMNLLISSIFSIHLNTHKFWYLNRDRCFRNPWERNHSKQMFFHTLKLKTNFNFIKTCRFSYTNRTGYHASFCDHYQLSILSIEVTMTCNAKSYLVTPCSK